MSQKKSHVPAVKASLAVPSDCLEEIFGEPPLLHGEDNNAYLTLKGRLFASVSPEDDIEQIWVYDILNLTWESKRLRGLKVKLIKASSYEGISQLIKPMVDHYTREDLVKKWAINDNAGVERVSEMLDKSFLDQGSINAQVVLVKLGHVIN